MNPITNPIAFAKNVYEGAKSVNPGMIGRGIQRAGGQMLNMAKNDIGSLFDKKRQIAQKMGGKVNSNMVNSPKNSSTPQQYNRGFNDYKKVLDQGNSY